MARHLRRDDYTVGWVCALSVELAAAQEMLDEEHDTPSSAAHNTNIYTCRRVGEHNVVIACLPGGKTGTNSAAASGCVDEDGVLVRAVQAIEQEAIEQSRPSPPEPQEISVFGEHPFECLFSYLKCSYKPCNQTEWKLRVRDL
jgi:hypothetical protein